MKKKKNKSKIFGWTALLVFSVSLIVAIFGLSNAVTEIEDVSVAKTPEAILESVGISDEEKIYLPVVYYDQKADECVNLYDTNSNSALYRRQFEWSKCGYHHKGIEKGLAEFELNEKYLPVASAGRLTSNRGIDFGRWFNANNENNVSYNGNLEMRYTEYGAEFVFEADDFYPLDAAESKNGDSVNADGHNHLFTMNFAVPFTVLGSGEEEFVITADDDTFVFVGNKLAIDMGGIHEATTGRFVIYENGEIYSSVDGESLAYSGIKVEKGEGSIVRVFHADRDSTESTFDVKFAKMNLSTTESAVAKDGGVQIAYDPSDPTYVPPLGESFVFRADSTEGLVVMMTIEGVMVVLVAVLVASVARFMIKQKVGE